MSALAPLLTAFHRAILARDAGIVTSSLRAQGRISPQMQMAIYIEGYRTRLVGALQSDYPELLAYLGENGFAALAHAYIEAVPPNAPSLDVYPFAFADFVRVHCKDGFAVDLAVLESAIAKAFLLADSVALDAEKFSAISAEDFSGMRLSLRKASLLLSLSYPVEDYFSARRAGETPPVPAASQCYMMVLRHDNTVRRHVLHPVAFSVLAALRDGLCVGEALERGAAAQEDGVLVLSQHLQSWFSQWVASGFFQHYPE